MHAGVVSVTRRFGAGKPWVRLPLEVLRQWNAVSGMGWPGFYPPAVLN
jgi:hypothetical protein